MMTTTEALQFLCSHQPLPPTRGIDETLLRKLDEIREYLSLHPDNRSVPLLLNVFGEGDGHGVYQLVEDTIRLHPENVVIPALVQGLNSPHGSVRYWNAQIAANYAKPELIEPLARVLEEGGVDERLAAVAALEAIGNAEARKELVNALELNLQTEVKESIRGVLRNMEGSR